MPPTQTAITTKPAKPARTELLLTGAIVPTLARLSAPNCVVSFAQTAAAIVDAWCVGGLGIAPLAALALVLPVQVLMPMMSSGAMGGGVSSAVARAIGSGDRPRAEAIALHAMIIGLLMGLAFTLFFAVLARPLFALLGGADEVLDGAVSYARIVFGGAAIVWIANMLASLLRGTGNMLVPGIVLTLGAGLHAGLSLLLTTGRAGAPDLGVAGPAAAYVASFLFSGIVIAIYLASGRAEIGLKLRGVTLDRRIFADILRVGAVACLNAVLTVVTVLVVTGLVGRYGTAALAGYGLGSRFELLLVPIMFSVGAAMTAMVGTNRGAGQHARARAIAWTGATAVGAFLLLLGSIVAWKPDLWIGMFTSSQEAALVGQQYFAIAGPAFAFYGFGQALYFASQGTGTMTGPLMAGIARMVVAAGGGLLLVTASAAPLWTVFAAVAAGFLAFGVGNAWSVLSGRNWHPEKSQNPTATETTS